MRNRLSVRLFRAVSAVLFSLCVFMVSGCAAPPKASEPMLTQLHPHPRAAELRENRRALVLLPGRGDPFGVFDQRRFVEFVQAQTDFDVIEVDANLSYYLDRSIVRRMQTEVLRPLRERGYREIWLAGISLGGLGSIFTVMEHPEQISGIVLIAPYLGQQPIINEIKKAGGLANWQADSSRPDDYEARVWAWLKERADRNDLPIWLAYGRNDYLSAGHRLLEAALPPERVLRERGAHNWRTWGALWPQLVDVVWVDEGDARYALDGGGAVHTH